MLYGSAPTGVLRMEVSDMGTARMEVSTWAGRHETARRMAADHHARIDCSPPIDVAQPVVWMFVCCDPLPDPPSDAPIPEHSAFARVGTDETGEECALRNLELQMGLLRVQAPRTTAEPSRPSAEKTKKPMSFVASLRRSFLGQEVGLGVETFEPSKVYIASVSTNPDTAVQRYNESAPEAERIAVGDYISEIDGETAPRFVEKLMMSESLQLTIQRPQLFTVVVTKCGLPLGLEIKHAPGGSSLTVTRIEHTGAVRAFGANIAAGDRIVAVGGRSGCVAELLSELRHAKRPELTISRCGWATGLSMSISRREALRPPPFRRRCH